MNYTKYIRLIDEYLEEPHSIDKELVECLRVCRELLEKQRVIEKAVAFCERLIDGYDRNREITDLDICHLIEMLKGRE